MKRIATVVLAGAALLGMAGSAQAALGPLPPQNPATAANGAATMHGDSASSGTTPLPGPGTGSVHSKYIGLLSACPTVLAGRDGYPLAICTAIIGRNPTIHLLDPGTGRSLAQLKLSSVGGDVFGGIYGYLDQNDQVVLVDPTGHLLRIAHRQTATGWELYVASSIDIGQTNIVGLAPDWSGNVWFATGAGVVGTVNPATGAVATLDLGEAVANSISTVPQGTAVSTDHALYLLRAGADGTPAVVWRQAYERGPGRKPGQLSWGTGSTPAFFGPGDGTEYVTITDNAAPRENLLVYDTATGDQVCDIPVLTKSGTESGTEDAPIASGNSVFVSATFGYPYPALPADAGTSVPAGATFTGGLTRVDVTGNGCVTKWDSAVRSATVPRLSLADGQIYTVAQRGSGLFASYDYTVLSADTGATLDSRWVGTSELFDTLQLAGSILSGQVYYQGTITGILRITP